MIYEVVINASDAFYALDVELDGVSYALDFAWSDRSSLWFMSLYYLDNGQRVPVALGIAVLSGYPLLAAVASARRPSGELQVICEGRDPGRNDLGSFAKLYYLDAAEFGR